MSATRPGSIESMTDERLRWHPEPDLISPRDPESGRAALERAGSATWAAALDYLYDEAFRRAMGEPARYADLRALYYGAAAGPGPAPADPTPLAELLEEFRVRLAPHQLNSWHPRSLSYFTPPPLVASIVGEVLAQFTNQGIDVWHAGPVGAFVEEEVIRWLCDVVGYGDGAFGILTSGGVMANFLAMTLARDVHLPLVRGADRASPPPRGHALENVRVYVSDQAHFSIARALDELGFPPATLVVVGSDDRYRLHAAPVAAAIARDRLAGLTPLAIAAVAGSTNTGSVDLVPELADLAEREGLWLHVDAAYGGAARLSDRLAGRIRGLERADSVTVDPHKWFFQAYDIGGLLVRRREHLLQTFHRSPEYYPGSPAATSGGDARVTEPATTNQPLNFYQHGMEGTRRWRALKLWLSWKHLGTRGLAHLVELNVETAAHLVRRIRASADFEVEPAEPELSVVCFRHLPGGRDAAGSLAASDPGAIDAHQDRLADALERSGEGWLTTTTLRGRTWLRAGIVNYITTEADIDRLLATLRALAEEC